MVTEFAFELTVSDEMAAERRLAGVISKTGFSISVCGPGHEISGPLGIRPERQESRITELDWP